MGARSAQSGQTNRPVTTNRPPRHRTRPAACRRAQGRRYSGVVDAAPRLVSPVRPDRTLRWHARPPRSLKTRTPRRLPVTRARARGGASPAAAALSARNPSSRPELLGDEHGVRVYGHRRHRQQEPGHLPLVPAPGPVHAGNEPFSEAPSQPADPRSARSITLSNRPRTGIVAVDLGNHLAHLRRSHHAHAFRPCPGTPPGSWISAVAQMCGLM